MAKITYSRKEKIEEKKNIRKVIVFSILSVSLVAFLFVFGIQLVVRYTDFISSLSNSNTPFKKDDVTPPTQPRIELVSESTNRSKIDINGSSEPGSTVLIRKNNDEYEVLSNREGRFSLSVELNDGDNIIRAKSRDSAGNESILTEEIVIHFDNKEPELEIVKPGDNAEFYGQSQKQMTIEGRTESTARVSINEKVIIVDGNGHFHNQYSLSEGENTFKIKVQDEAGNATEREIKVIYNP